jgi:hypothetical protein
MWVWVVVWVWVWAWVVVWVWVWVWRPRVCGVCVCEPALSPRSELVRTEVKRNIICPSPTQCPPNTRAHPHAHTHTAPS